MESDCTLIRALANQPSVRVVQTGSELCNNKLNWIANSRAHVACEAGRTDRVGLIRSLLCCLVHCCCCSVDCQAAMLNLGADYRYNHDGCALTAKLIGFIRSQSEC